MSERKLILQPRAKDRHTSRRKSIKAGFKLDSAFYDELLQRLEEARAQANESFGRVGLPGGFLGGSLLSRRELYPSSRIPQRRHLEALVEKAFWASLQKEEGRSLSFSIGYDAPSPDRLLTVMFGEPLLFDVKTLTKLAPAVGNPDSGIAVSASDGKPLQVTGILAVNSAPFRIKVLDPGMLILSFASDNVAIISGDEAVFVRDRLLSRSSSIWSKLQGTQGATDYSAFSDPRVNVILDAVKSMRALGHGGALLIVPNDERWKKSIDHISYPIDPKFTQVSQTIKEMSEDEGKDEQLRSSNRWVLEMSAKAIAQLTAVDGATVVTHDLDAVAFGAKIKEAAESFEVIEIDPLDHEGYIHQTVVEKIGGKRHQSAARFIYNQRDAVALVASQDGNVTAFVWEEYDDKPNLNGLYAYRRLELTLF